jgi:hypothetical protein
MTEAHDKLQACLAEYKAAQAAVTDLEQKLAKAKDDEASALTADDAPETEVVDRMRDAQGLQTVYSRRLHLARERAGQALEPVRLAVLELYRQLDAKVSDLVESRVNAHQAVILARVDADTLQANLITAGYVIGFPIITTICDHAFDVLNAKACKPFITWVKSGQVTLERLEQDIAALTKAELEYQREAARTYDFDVPATTDTEPIETDLVEQTAYA